MIRRSLVVLVALGLTACDLLGGINPDQVELLGLIRRVELDPGVDALDMNGATIVGLDWQRINFHFTEPISTEIP